MNQKEQDGYRELIETQVKNTVGYHETEDEKSFMTGVSVAITKLESIYGERINQLEEALKNMELHALSLKTDLRTLSSIVNRYSENE